MNELSPGLLAALALTAKHLEPVTVTAPLLIRHVRVNAAPVSFNAKKKALNHKRTKLAAQSRKRNRR